MRDLLRVDANERVDFGDFEYAIQMGLEGHLRQVPDSILTKPGGQQLWVVSGFAISNPTAQQLRVDKGVAYLARREGVDALPGFVTTEGDPYRILDLSSYSQLDTHGIYIRFVYKQASTQGRLFWNATSEAEYAQSIPTRFEAGWELVVERVNPGAEWLKIGEVVPNGMVITDQRDFYFEGKISDAYAADGWGSGTDRNVDRAQYGITDFQTFTEMFRTVIEEVRSTSGNRRWWEAGIRDITVENGLRLGFTGNPNAQQQTRLEINDSNFTFGHLGATSPAIFFDYAANDMLSYDRTNNIFKFWIAYQEMATIRYSGLTVGYGGLRVGFTGEPSAADRIELGDNLFYLDYGSGVPTIAFDTGDNLQYDRTGNALNLRIGAVLKAQIQTGGLVLDDAGMLVGYTGTPSDGIAAFGSSALAQVVLRWTDNDEPRFEMDASDYMAYFRTANYWQWRIAATSEMELHASGLNVTDGVRVGFAGAPASADRIELGDAQCYWEFDGTDPHWYADTADFFWYDRSANTWSWLIGSATEMVLQSAGLTVADGLRVGFAGSPAVSGRIEVKDANFHLDFSSTYPTLSMDSGDYMNYIRSANIWRWFINSRPALNLFGTAPATLALLDTGGTGRNLSGDDFRVLGGYALLAEDSYGIVLTGLAVYCDEDADTTLYSPAGIARFPSGDVKSFISDASVDASVAGSWLDGAVHADQWGWAWRRSDGTLRLDDIPPTPQGVLQSTPDGGYTVYDYVFVGSFYYGGDTNRIIPFTRQGAKVYIEFAKRFAPYDPELVQRTVLAGESAYAVTETAGSGLAMPNSATWPNTSANGIFGVLHQLLNNSTDASAARLDHGRAASVIPATRNILRGISGVTVFADTWFEVIAFRSGTTITYCNLTYGSVTATSRVVSLEPLGYFEHLNHLDTNVVYA